MTKPSRDQRIKENLKWFDKHAFLDKRSSPAHIKDDKARTIIAEMLADKFPNGTNDKNRFGVLSRLRMIPHTPLFVTPGEHIERMRAAPLAAKYPERTTPGSITPLIWKMTAAEMLAHENENGIIPDRLKASK